MSDAADNNSSGGQQSAPQSFQQAPDQSAAYANMQSQYQAVQQQYQAAVQQNQEYQQLFNYLQQRAAQQQQQDVLEPSGDLNGELLAIKQVMIAQNDALKALRATSDQYSQQYEQQMQMQQMQHAYAQNVEVLNTVSAQVTQVNDTMAELGYPNFKQMLPQVYSVVQSWGPQWDTPVGWAKIYSSLYNSMYDGFKAQSVPKAQSVASNAPYNPYEAFKQMTS